MREVGNRCYGTVKEPPPEQSLFLRCLSGAGLSRGFGNQLMARCLHDTLVPSPWVCGLRWCVWGTRGRTEVSCGRTGERSRSDCTSDGVRGLPAGPCGVTATPRPAGGPEPVGVSGTSGGSSDVVAWPLGRLDNVSSRSWADIPPFHQIDASPETSLRVRR